MNLQSLPNPNNDRVGGIGIRNILKIYYRKNKKYENGPNKSR